MYIGRGCTAVLLVSMLRKGWLSEGSLVSIIGRLYIGKHAFQMNIVRALFPERGRMARLIETRRIPEPTHTLFDVKYVFQQSERVVVRVLS